MHRELVERRRWISEGRFLHALNYCMLLPGPEAQQLATYIGWLMHRTWGGIVAGGLFVLPSLLILTTLSWIYVSYGRTSFVASFFFGIKPAVVAIVAFAAYRIGSRVLRNAALLSIALLAFLAIFALKIPFPWIIIAAGVMGYVGERLFPEKFAHNADLSGSKKDYGPALIDDHTPPPPHARFRWSRAVWILAIAAVSWAGVLGALAYAQGLSGTLTQMGVFFTKAALLTFGGAYAVLPYVYQGAVDHYGWLTAPQMIDGLALGETTPGPLIMVVAFVGFMGAGIWGSVTATYFTFLPSFVLIFLGAPLVEATRDNLKLSSVLTGITAAVVGVILNLAVFFAYHVLWPQGFDGAFNWTSALIGIAAGVALFRFKLGVIPVVLASGLIGVLVRLSQPAY
jgi:chromate transporter